MNAIFDSTVDALAVQEPCSARHVAPQPRPEAKASVSQTALTAILTPADILLGLDVPNKKRAFEEIARFVAARRGLFDRDVHASLVAREALGSTALGYGIAIPHARVKGLSLPVGPFVRPKFPIPFDAPDGKPVSDMLVLLVPQHATDAHLLLLAEVAEMFCDRSFLERLRTCSRAAELHSALTQWPER